MKVGKRRVRRRSVKIALAMLVFLPGLSGRAQETAEAILQRLRASRAQEVTQELAGALRTAKGENIPFRVRFLGEETSFKFENPPEVLKLRLTDEGSVLLDETAQGSRQVSGPKLTAAVRGTDVNYEDLALKFLYWDRAKLEAEQQLSIYSCWVVLVQASNSAATNYGSVRLWIPKNRSGLVQAEAFDRDGKLVKRFKVISVQEIAGKWLLKEMRIERFAPPATSPVSRTYLELSKS
jgi:Outer membrane lipoprotein-sorting protein